MTELELIEDFSENVQRMMQARKMSQNELSKMTGLSQGTISRAVGGRYMPTIKTVVNISCALKCDISDLIYAHEMIE